VKDYKVAISSSSNFRKKLFKEYKANRLGTRKPLGYKKLQQYCLDTHLVCQLRMVLRLMMY
jgi:hypothetical protein